MAKVKYKQRKDGRYQTSVVLNGKKQYVIAKSAEELNNKVAELTYKSQIGLSTNTSSITFKQYAEKWFEINISSKEEATQNSVKNRLNHAYKYIGHIKIKDLKQYHIQEIVTEMQKEGYKDITNRTLAEVKRVLEDAVINDVISKNVANGVKKIKYAKEERKFLTLSEDKKVYECALNNKYGLFILLLRYCGLRPEEAVALTIDDVDIDNKELIVNKAVSLAKNQPKIKATKNLKNRKIPIPNFLFELLEKIVNNKQENGSKFIFTKETDNNAMLTKQALKTHLNAFLNTLNKDIKEDKNKIYFTYYNLRHSYGTMLYYSGIGLKKAQELMGHSSAKMLYEIYAHLDEERENAKSSIDNYINNNILEKS